MKVLLLVWLAISPIAAVTCYGENGHVAVEFAFHGCCSVEGSDCHANVPFDASSESESNYHEHCQDVPLEIVLTINLDDHSVDSVGAQEMVIAADRIAGNTLKAILDRYSVYRVTCPHIDTPLTSIILLL